MLELSIIGGTVVDGSGTPGRHASVGIAGGRIVAIGEDVGPAAEVIDATGQVVSPGFVDIHTHYDAQVLWDPELSVSPSHGVTSVVIGNCGFGLAPTRPAHRELVVRTLEKVEGMSAEALEAGLGDDWGFESFPEYLDRVEAVRPLVNVAALLGHTPLRLAVLGPEATEREARTDEVRSMRELVAEAMAAGAIGFSTSKSPTHVGFGGHPVPSRAALLDEVLELVGPLRDAGRGVIQATLGPGLLFEEMARIAEGTGRPLCWTALLANTGDGIAEWMLSESAALQDRGIPVVPQASCRPLQFEYTLAEPFPYESMSLFAPISAATDQAAKLAVYRDPAWRTELARAHQLGRTGSLQISLDRTVVSWFPPDPTIEGRTVGALAAEQGVEGTELLLELALETDLAARFRVAAYNYDDDAVAPLLQSPYTILGLSDAGAHASQLCDACFSTHLLGHWVRERASLTLEEAVHMLTAQAAEVFGLTDRGLLAEGRPADVVVFDPATVGAGPLRRVHDLPAGAERLVVDAIGIDAVVVNGVVIRRGGQAVADVARPGRLLRAGHA